MVLIGIICFLFLFYVLLIWFYTNSWKQIPLQVVKTSALNNRPAFSIIIPARNEEAAILSLLESIKKQTYPAAQLEVIVVDDHSSDRTAALVQNFAATNRSSLQVQLVSLKNNVTNSYKKKAIESGIATAQHNWIVCTDADCQVPPYWLQSFAQTITEKDSVFIAAPVTFTKGRSVVHLFQDLDFLTLQGITGASVYKNVHSMCNGANLAYRKDVFYEVEGFKGIDTIASGDDLLLMHKIWKKYPQQTHYLKSQAAIVKTAAAPTWKAFLNQRIRWASKATSYDDKRISIVLLLVYLFNFSFLFLFIAGLFNYVYLYAFLGFMVLKTLIEYPFISSVSSFFDKRSLLKYFFPFQLLHIAYTILAGFLGSFGKYEWKGRRVK